MSRCFVVVNTRPQTRWVNHTRSSQIFMSIIMLSMLLNSMSRGFVILRHLVSINKRYWTTKPYTLYISCFVVVGYLLANIRYFPNQYKTLRGCLIAQKAGSILVWDPDYMFDKGFCCGLVLFECPGLKTWCDRVSQENTDVPDFLQIETDFFHLLPRRLQVTPNASSLVDLSTSACHLRRPVDLCLPHHSRRRLQPSHPSAPPLTTRLVASSSFDHFFSGRPSPKSHIIEFLFDYTFAWITDLIIDEQYEKNETWMYIICLAYEPR